MPNLEDAKRLAQAYGTKEKCDVLLYNGPIIRGADHEFIQMCRARRKRPSVLWILTTSGGDAHVAYRMARTIQQMYKQVRIFIPGWCKSAGTLIAIAAHEIIIGDLGELGPIDVQRPKSDDLWESSSGLTEDAAISTLETAAWSMFERFVFEVKRLSDGKVTFKTAAEAAAPMVAGMLSPIFAQVDPLKIGENSRAMKIASDYGQRLNVYSHNLRVPQSMDSLVSGYPSHGFVIDRAEAEVLFRNVSVPGKDLERICDALKEGAFFPLNEGKPHWSQFINPEVVERQRTRKDTGDAHGKPQTTLKGGGRRKKTGNPGDSSTATERRRLVPTLTSANSGDLTAGIKNNPREAGQRA